MLRETPLGSLRWAGRKYDAVEGYGLLSVDYQHFAAPKVIDLLRTIEDQPAR